MMMIPAKNLFYFNALFDMAMGGHTRAPLKRAADEMSVLIIPMSSKDDFCLIKTAFAPDYTAFLEDNGLVLPKLVNVNERFDSSIIARPWGWDEEALETFKKMGAGMSHPAIDIVKKINNRQFCDSFNEIEKNGVPGSVLLKSSDDVKNFFANNPNFPLVVKPAHGSSGFGFFRLDESPDKTTVNKIFQLIEQDIIIVEPWLKRIMDVSSSVDIGSDGGLSAVRHYQCLVDSKGTFYGVYLPPDQTRLKPWIPALDKHAAACAEYIYKRGYFGPVGFDSFVYLKDNEPPALAPIIEINARHVMSDIARALKSKLAPDKYVLYRLLSSKRAKLPESYSRLKNILREHSFSAAAKKGILPLTPLRNTTDITRQPYRNAFFISAESEEELFRMDSFLINALSPHRNARRCLLK